MKFPIEQIWIDEDAADEPLTEQIVKKLPRAGVLVGDEFTLESRALNLQPDPVTAGKRILRLMRHKGAFVKPCPGTPAYVCCGLEILHIGQGCPMDCRYCALQVYFNRPTIEVFVNTDDLMLGLRQHIEENPGRPHRICTGEFTDSLALDPLTGLAERLIPFFAGQADATLEIKTKTDHIEPLLELHGNDRVILSFSVNSQRISKNEEIRAVSLDRRLEAAARAQENGYRIGFHFDPIIPVPGWEEGYFETVARIFHSVAASGIAWISMGVLRFVPELKEIARGRFGPIPYFHDGFLRGLDGKSRLHADRRIDIYRRLVDRIRNHHSDAVVYLCMESPHVWKHALGIGMESTAALTAYLDEAAFGQGVLQR
ncbi:MAG: DNA photolyase [Desulfomonile tiedjei]|nr:DNA photolyase [Desulfomonile tiedjei]